MNEDKIRISDGARDDSSKSPLSLVGAFAAAYGGVCLGELLNDYSIVENAEDIIRCIRNDRMLAVLCGVFGYEAGAELNRPVKRFTRYIGNKMADSLGYFFE